MSKIFDSHSHYMPPEVAENTSFFKAGWSDIDHQLSVMDKNGIVKSLLLYPTSDAHLKLSSKDLCRKYNQSIHEISLLHKDRFVGACILPLDNPNDLKDELNVIKDSGFFVISLPSSYNGKFLDDESFLPVLEFARANGLVIHVHPQIMNPIGVERVMDPLLTPVLEYIFDVSMCIGKMMMSGVFNTFSDVKFVFAHYGGVLPFVKERFDNTYLMLRKRDYVRDLSGLPSDYFKNLYIDTSGSKSPGSLLCALEITDASHVLFGSDFPANQNIVGSISCIKNAPISDEEKDLILENNLFER